MCAYTFLSQNTMFYFIGLRASRLFNDVIEARSCSRNVTINGREYIIVLIILITTILLIFL